MQTDTQAKLVWFTKAEDELLTRLRAVTQEPLPERLAQWRTWIGDPIIYINELRNHVDKIAPHP